MTTFWVSLYLLACPMGWYAISLLHYGLNGGQPGRHPYFFPFQCFAEEIKCYWFGGQKYRIEFIKEQCYVDDGVFCGYRRSYNHREIREKNLYEEVFWAMMGGRISFWGGHLFSFFFGPMLVAIFIVAVIFGWTANFLIFWPLDKVFGTKLAR